MTILTGFLGAGKTTLLNRFLKENQEQQHVVIVNEFGELSIDRELIIQTKEEIVEINSGCICCNVRGDLLTILLSLIKRKMNNELQYDRIIIETTGLANPAPIIQTFLMDDVIVKHFAIDCVCTVLDSKHILHHIDSETVLEQIAFADVLILNKTDLIEQNELENMKARMKRINSSAKMVVTSNCNIAISQIIHVHSFELGDKVKQNLQKIQDDYVHKHHHEDDVSSIVITDERPLNLEKVNQWFSYLVQIQGESLYRYKGILHIANMEERVVFQGVHMLFSGKNDRRWRDDEIKCSKMVFIGKNLEQLNLEKGFQYCIA